MSWIDSGGIRFPDRRNQRLGFFLAGIFVVLFILAIVTIVMRVP